MTNRVRYSQANARIAKVHNNTDQELIVITADKLELVLQRHLSNLERRKEWIAPLGILIAIASAFSTATFKDAYFSAATWQAIFVITGILSSIWLVKTGWTAIRAPALSEIMDKIKQSSDKQSNNQLQRTDSSASSV